MLGPNGAGKTTTLRCIATIIKPTKGEIYVSGHEVQEEPEEVRKKIGFLTSDIKLDPQFTTDYLFDFFGRLHNVPEENLRKRKEELFEYFEIKDFAHKQIKELSTGMKQKAARNVTDYLRKLRDEGKLVIVSTHIMSEAEKLCDRIGIVIDGTKVAEGTLEELLQQTNAQDLEDAFFEFYKLRRE